MKSLSRRSRFLIFLTLDIALIFAVVGFLQAREAPGRVVDRYLSVYSQADMDALLELYSSDATFVDVSQRHEVSGREGLQEQFQQLGRMHKAMKVVEKRRATNGKLVTVEVVYSGTLDCAALGFPEHEEMSYEIPAVLLFEIEDGQIHHQTDYLDFRTLAELRQAMQASTGQ